MLILNFPPLWELQLNFKLWRHTIYSGLSHQNSIAEVNIIVCYSNTLLMANSDQLGIEPYEFFSNASSSKWSSHTILFLFQTNVIITQMVDPQFAQFSFFGGLCWVRNFKKKLFQHLPLVFVQLIAWQEGINQLF